MMKSSNIIIIIFAIALSYLLSLYEVEATSRTLTGQVAPGALEEICSKTDFSKECSSALAKFIAPAGKIDANAALLAGLKALEAETTKAITEAQKLSKAKPKDKAAEQLMVGMAVYNVVSNTTKKALKAIQANKKSELKKEIKLASDVTGELLDNFQEGIEGKNDVMKDINVYIHQLAQNNFDILGLVMKTEENDQENQKKEENEEEDEKEEDEDEDEEEDKQEVEEEDDSDPAPASSLKPQPAPSN